MTRVLVHAYDVKRDHLDAYDVEALIVPAIVDEKTWVPELDREDLLYHRLFLAEKWLVLKLRYGHADPRDAGVGNIVNCGAAMYIAPVGIANAGDPDGAYAEALDLTAAHQSSYGREAAGVLAAAVAEAMRLEATPDTVVETCLRLAKDGTRTAIEAVAEAAAKLDGWRDGGLAELQACLRAVRLGRRALRHARAERADPEPAALDRGAADRDRAARRDRRRLRGDRPRRRQLRPRLGLDRLDGRRARRRARQLPSAATGSTTSPRRARSTSRRRAARWPSSRRRSSSATSNATRSARVRSPPWRPERCLLEGHLGAARGPVGHELRQAREEGKDVDDVEERWFGAGGAPAPGRGASQEPVAAGAAGARARAARRARRDAAAARRRGAGRLRRDPRRRPIRRPRAPPVDVAERIAGAWLGRAVGCVLGKPVENIPREGIRAIAEATGNWPVAGWFTAEGLPEEVSERWPWNRASRPTSLAENIDGIPEDDDLNFTMLGVALLERCGTGFDALDVAKIWLDYMPPGRIFTAERVAMRNLLEAYLPPETATRRNPFREWIGARLRVDAYGWAAPGDPVAAARMAWEDARVSHTANGVYAAMFMAAAHAASLSESSAAACADAGLSVVPARSRLAEALRTARDLARRARVGGRRRRALRALRLPLGARDQQHRARRRGALRLRRRLLRRDLGASSRAASTPTRTAPRSARSSARSPAPAASRSAGRRRSHGRFASSLPGFDGITIDELVRRTLAVVAAPAAA